MAKKKRKKLWIQAAFGKYSKRKKGALHRQLGVSPSKKIPAAKLRAAAKKPGKLGRRARMAITLRKLGKRRKR